MIFVKYGLKYCFSLIPIYNTQNLKGGGVKNLLDFIVFGFVLIRFIEIFENLF